MKKLIALTLVLLFAVYTLAGCAGQPAADAQQPVADTPATSGGEDEILIGGLFNLTGDQASLDNPAMKAAQLAVKQINEAGGINGKQIKYIIENCQTDQTASTNAAEKVISVDKVDAIVGLSDSTFVLAAGAIAQKNNIPFIEIGGTMPGLPDQVGDVLYMACFGDNVQAYAGVDFAVKELGAKTAWLFIDTATDYTVTLGKHYKERFTELNGEGSVLMEDTYQTSDVDFKAQISRLKALKTQPDVLLITADPSATGLIVKQIREMGIDTPIIGGDGFDTPVLIETAGELATDVYFTTHIAFTDSNEVVQKFIADYKAEYGVEPETSFAGLGYDAMNLMADAIRRAGSLDHDAIKKAIGETTDLPGATGTLSFRNGSHVPTKAVTIMQIDKGQVSFVKQIIPE